MTDGLSSDLVQRLRARAGDPDQRSGDASLAATSVDAGTALSGLRLDPSHSEEFRSEMADYLSGVSSPFAGLMTGVVTGDDRRARGLLAAVSSLVGGPFVVMSEDLGAVSFGTPSAPRPAAPPADEDAVRAAEAALGFALPAELRQLYLEVADGGFGPGGGLFSLAELVAKHEELAHEPVGPQGQSWPAELLPVQGEDWDLVSLDRTTGRLVFWDLEELDDDELPPEQPTWAASFVPEADSLEAWLAAWESGGR